MLFNSTKWIEYHSLVFVKYKTHLVESFDNRKVYNITVENGKRAPYCIVHEKKHIGKTRQEDVFHSLKITTINKNLTITTFVAPCEIKKIVKRFGIIHSVIYLMM